MLIIYITIVAITLIWIINRWYLRAYVRLAYKVPSNKWHTLLGWGKLLSAKETILKRDLEHTDYNAINMLNDVHEIQEIITVSCVSYSFKLNWIRKIAEVTVFKNGYKCVAKLKKIIADSVDILQNNVTTDPSYCPDVNSALECALNGVNQNVLKLDEIEGEIAQLFAAAFDTTSITIFLVIMLLAMHPQYQERAYEEIVSILPNNENDDDHIRLEQLNQLVYLEMIFNETIRVLPVVPMVLRKVTKEDLALSNGITLPVGHILCIDIFSLHRSKELWGPKADIFNPDNFLPSNVASRDPFSFIPFTKGQRFCIGWRYATLFTKIALVNLIKTFKFTTDYKYRDLKFTSRITLQLSENPQINVERRKTGEY